MGRIYKIVDVALDVILGIDFIQKTDLKLQ